MTARRKRRPKRPPPAALSEAAYELRIKREIVSRFGMWETCGRRACCRAMACREPGVACFDEKREIVQDCLVDEARETFRLAAIPAESLVDDP